MDWATVLRGIEDALASDLGRAEKAVQIAELVRQAGSYRWVGLYAVTDQEITANWLERPRGACPPALSGDPRAQRGGRRHRAGRGRQRRDRRSALPDGVYEHPVGGDRAGGGSR